MCEKCDEAIAKITPEDQKDLRNEVEKAINELVHKYELSHPKSPAFLLLVCANIMRWQGNPDKTLDYIISQLCSDYSIGVMIDKYSEEDSISHERIM